jgi:hypothetical protein
MPISKTPAMYNENSNYIIDSRRDVMRRKTMGIFLTAIIVVAGIQFIQPERNNPPVNLKMTFEATANPSKQITDILHRSCYNCHSNSTQWPLYSHVAPVSWFIADDVKQGRRHLNFSEWGRLTKEETHVKLQDICQEVSGGEMPLYLYTLMHKEAKLSPQDKALLCKSISGMK